METADMEKTVMEDKTPMVSTSKWCITSISGLMITPPPIPVREPTVVAPMAIKKYSMYCIEITSRSASISRRERALLSL